MVALIDTLRLHLVDYEIDWASVLTVQPSPFEVGTGKLLDNHLLYRDSSGVEVQGAKAFYNSDTVNVSINPKGAFVQFSIPKNATGCHNYHAVGKRGSKAVLERVERELAGVGLHTGIAGAKVSRIDTFKNVVAEDAFSDYHGMFALLQAKRVQKRDYGTTFLWHNTQQEFCVYDKLEEMRLKGLDVRDLPENTIRFEHRLLNAQKVRSALEISTVGELWEGYDRVREHFRKSMSETLFRYEVQEIEVLSGNQLKQEMLFYKDRAGRYWFQRYLEAVGLDTLLQKVEFSTLLDVLGELCERTWVWRLKKRLEQTQLELSMLRQAYPLRRTTGQLYAELRRKVLAA